MKDKFFEKLNKLYNKIYRYIVKITYLHITHKRSKGNKQLKNQEKEKINNFWKKEYGKKIFLNEYKWYKQKRNIIEPEIIPDVVWHSEIEPYFNNLELVKAFEEKNYFSLILDRENIPETLVRCINNQFLDENYKPINKRDILKILKANNEIICKPTIDTGGGRGIQIINNSELQEKTMDKLLKQYKGNFIIQKLIVQNDFFKQFNKNSVNTMRIVTFLFKGNFYVLSSFLRIGGKNSRLDNVSSGGSFIPISKDGILDTFSYRENLDTHDLIRQENLKISMNDRAVPHWKDIIKKLEEYHYKLSHFGIINWDVTLNNKNKPIIIEYNLLDSSVYFHQIHNGPIFGDLTLQVLNTLKNGSKESQK